MISIGQLVFSKNGRDKDDAFFIIKIEKDFVYLANGKRRTLNKPKRKKIKHIQITNFISEDIKTKVESKSYMLDSDLRNAIKEYFIH